MIESGLLFCSCFFFFLISWITYLLGLKLWQSGEIFYRTGQTPHVDMLARYVPTRLYFRLVYIPIFPFISETSTGYVACYISNCSSTGYCHYHFSVT